MKILLKLNGHYVEELKRGFTVYHAMAGKNTIGTARPGNNSGNLIFKGNVMEIGIITQAKEIIDNKKLKTTSPFCLSHVIKSQYSSPAIIHDMIFKPIILPVFSTILKSASVAKK
jgi:hypothetical protein